MEDPDRREIVTEDTRGMPADRRSVSTSRGGAPPGYSFRAVHLIWLATGVVDALIAIRFVLKALGASQVSAFVNLIYGITDPLLAPFRGIFPIAATRGSVLEPAAVVAFIVYLLVGWGLVALIRIITTPRGTRMVD